MRPNARGPCLLVRYYSGRTFFLLPPIPSSATGRRERDGPRDTRRDGKHVKIAFGLGNGDRLISEQCQINSAQLSSFHFMSGSGVPLLSGRGGAGSRCVDSQTGGVIVRVRWDRRKSGRERTGEVNEFQLSPREAFRCVALLFAQHDCWINLHCTSRRYDTGDERNDCKQHCDAAQNERIEGSNSINLVLNN